MGFPASLVRSPGSSGPGSSPSGRSQAPALAHEPISVAPLATPTDLRKLWHQQAGLRAAQEQHEKARDEAAEAVREAQSYLDHKDEVAAALDALATRAQARSRGVFEGLLTTLVREVMPDKADKILLNSGRRNHKRTLDVDVEINGAIENVFRDKGGAMKNLVSMGLRFIVLSRSMNRRFLVFDEADCWLKTEHIPVVAQLVFELSHRIGVQVIYISHHSTECFAGRARVVNIKSDGDTVLTQVGEEPPPPSLDGVIEQEENAGLMEGLGLQYLRLVNFKRHESTHIPLSPYVTVIAGDIDVGKSAIVQALECVTDNAGRTGIIRHGTQECEVEIGLEEGRSLSWRYRRAGSKKTRYTLTDAQGCVEQSYDRATEPPPWLDSALGMGPVGEFNLHLQRQTEPNFLIDNSVTATRRAELLSLGEEAYYVQRMAERHSERVSELTRSSNERKRALARHLNALKSLESIDALTESITRLEQSREHLIGEEKKRQELGHWLKRLTACQARVDALRDISRLASPKAPELKDARPLRVMAQKLADRGARQKSLSALDSLKAPSAPSMTDTQALVAMGSRLSKAQKRLAQLERVPEPVKAPALEPTKSLGSVLDRLNALAKRARASDEEIERQQADHQLTAKKRETLIESLGGICPACDQHMANKEAHNHA